MNENVLSFILCPCSLAQRLDASLKKATPWLVLAGSGPAADLISELLDNLSPVSLSPTSPPVEGEAAQGLSTEHRDRVRDKVRKHFPAEAELEKLVDNVSQTAHAQPSQLHSAMFLHWVYLTL